MTIRSHRSAMTAARIALVAGAAVGIGGLWYMASVPWGLDFSELVPFVAPGALLGVGAGWMSHAMKPDQWTWKAGRNAAIAGALALPPIITVGLALVGARPERVLSMSVRAAWLALIGGAIWSIGAWVIHRLEHRTA
jgi:hypothetical protein